jgi:thioredoxin 1
MHRLLLLILLLTVIACHTTQKTPVRPAGKPKTTQHQPPKSPTDLGARPTLPVDQLSTNIAWVQSERLMPVLEEAGRVKKPVFVVFHASWCAPCKVMEEEIFTQPDAYRFLNEKCLSFQADFDTEAGKTIAGVYEVKQIPTVLFLDPNGVVLERYKGIISVAEIQRMGAAAALKVK